MRLKTKSVVVTLSAMTVGLAALASQKSAYTLTKSYATDLLGTSEVKPSFTIAQAVPLKSKVQLTGQGATFPAPLYQNWFVLLNRKVPNLQVNYQGTGSGAGVEQFIKGTVDFAGSDVAMKDAEIGKVSKGVLLLPVTAGSIVLAYNLPGVSKLQLSQPTYVDIFLGKITKWNDPKIVKDNPGVKLPDTGITVVHRADGSGTTGVFTENLSAMSPEWKKTVGAGKSVQWPKGKFIGSKGNDGVTASIKQNPGSIGYVEYGYAKNNKVSFAVLGNKAGKFVEANPKTGAATLAAVKLPANLRAFILNPDGAGAYPFVTYTWLLVYKKYDNPEKALAVEGMIDYAINEGQAQSEPLGYIPLPKEVRQKIAAAADGLSPGFKITVR
jgi:phosphate transport system substrate-binding protein